MDDPRLWALYEDALRNPDLCGILADWLEDYGHPEAAALARVQEPIRARGACELRVYGLSVWARHQRAVGRFLIESKVDLNDHQLRCTRQGRGWLYWLAPSIALVDREGLSPKRLQRWIPTDVPDPAIA